MLDVILTKQFRKEYRKMSKRGYVMSKLDEVVDKLKNQEQFEPKNRDHDLEGDWEGYRECHIQPNWSLFYKVDNGALVLTLSRMGKYSDRF